MARFAIDDVNAEVLAPALAPLGLVETFHEED
jgi:hypothetical protein